MPLPHLSATSQTRLALQVLRSVDAQTVKLQHAHSDFKAFAMCLSICMCYRQNGTLLPTSSKHGVQD